MACAPYPRDAPMLDELRAEVEHQARRLAGHPCIALWGGNNEVEASLSWYPASRANPALYAVDFQVTFVEAVRGVLQRLDPGRVFLDSSPSSGLLSAQPYVKRWGDAQVRRAGGQGGEGE